VTGIGGIYRRFRRRSQGRLVVAAVPVRARAAGGLEFLIVRTRNGARWTFPKGGCDRGESLAAAAAREAVEEAGAAGRLIGEPFAEYRYGDDLVTAFLLVVDEDDLEPEPGRDPAWFGFEAARSRLVEGRDGAFGAQMERVLLAAQHAAGRVL
jgi:8-oxo-dGTP pyrophosphatase MutT (NUDIX family)